MRSLELNRPASTQAIAALRRGNRADGDSEAVRVRERTSRRAIPFSSAPKIGGEEVSAFVRRFLYPQFVE
jgi:hypothetical protein